MDPEQPRVDPQTNALSGWLFRKTGKMGLWKKRFFNYDPSDRTLSYFADEVRMMMHVSLWHPISPTCVCLRR